MDYKNERLLLEEVVKKAAELCLTFKKEGFKTEDKKTGQKTDYHQAKAEGFHGDYVTEADLAVDKLLYNALKEARPDYGWLSEESVTEDNWKGKDYLYIVDPIDGTAQFVFGGSYSVSVGLMHKGEMVASAIATPKNDHLFSASKGEGVFLNGQKIEELQNCSFSDIKIAVSCSEHRKGKWAAYEEDLNVCPVGSIANKLARVAADFEQMCLVRHPLNSWDVAAGILMVEEMGLKVTDMSGAPIKLTDYLDAELQGIFIGPEGSREKVLEIIS